MVTHQAFLDPIVDRLSELPGVVAVSLGGSRASRKALGDSDWDLGLYYRGRFDAGHLKEARL